LKDFDNQLKHMLRLNAKQILEKSIMNDLHANNSRINMKFTDFIKFNFEIF
jgi:hypothetical protein